jgi:hypothetical protein
VRDSLLQITANRDSQRRCSTDEAPACETKQTKLENVLQWLVLQSINDYLQIHVYEQ